MPKKKEDKIKEVEEVKQDISKDTETKVVEDNDVQEDDDKKSKLFLQAIGRRKTSVARVRIIKNGSGKATVNEQDIKDYFGTDLMVEIALGALISVNQLKKLDVSVKTSGGGKKGQAEAIRLGTARALLQLNPVFKKNLRKVGFLTRDPRAKERKKPGLKRARKAPQWSKR